MKTVFRFCFFLFCFTLFSGNNVYPAYAKLVINEFSSGTASDWVEIYNDSDQEEPLSDYALRDETASNKLELQGILAAKGYMLFEWSDRLNNPGDVIRIVKKDNEADEIDRVIYGSKDGAVISAPSDIQYAARVSDAGSIWALYTASTKGITNNHNTPLPTATPLPTETPKPTATPTKTPTPTRVPTNTTESQQTTLHPTGVLGSTTQRNSPTPDYQVPTAVLAERTEKEFLESIPEKKKPMVKTKGIAAVNPAIVLMGVGTLFLLSCLGYGYHSYKKGLL